MSFNDHQWLLNPDRTAALTNERAVLKILRFGYLGY